MMPFISHTNFKILVFLSIVFYAYMKMKRLNATTHNYFRIIDDVRYKKEKKILILKIWFLFILGIKNYYHNMERHGYRSDVRNIASLAFFMIFNHMCGGSSVRTLQEDFFFSASGNVLLSYFFM